MQSNRNCECRKPDDNAAADKGSKARGVVSFGFNQTSHGQATASLSQIPGYHLALTNASISRVRAKAFPIGVHSEAQL